MVDPETTYRRQTPGSRALHESAVAVMPGGTTRTTTYFDPYPLYITRGEGCRIWDADGTERLDMLGNYTAMILGHAHPKVVEAIRKQAAQGTGFAAANPVEVKLAALLCERVPSLEMVRFCNSGTEATMFAMRLARAFTGRPKIARIEGGYHGTHDYAEVSTHPNVSEAGPPDAPIARPDSIGTPDWALERTVVLPFNNPDAAEAIIRREGRQLAAVILEPIIGAGGVIAATGEFLQRLRTVTKELGIVLIFDEVISFRVGPGGAQELYGVTPDLTTLGKIIGGGLPVAAFGGRADVMELLDPRRKPSLAQGGTYNGNPLGMAAGLAAIQSAGQTAERPGAGGEPRGAARRVGHGDVRSARVSPRRSPAPDPLALQRASRGIDRARVRAARRTDPRHLLRPVAAHARGRRPDCPSGRIRGLGLPACRRSRRPVGAWRRALPTERVPVSVGAAGMAGPISEQSRWGRSPSATCR